MKSNNVKIILTILVIVLFIGCLICKQVVGGKPGNKNETAEKVNGVEKQVVHTDFSIDKDTVKVNDVSKLIDKAHVDNNMEKLNNSYNYDEHLGEVVFNEPNESSNFDVVGDDVVYNGITYHGMYSSVSQVSKPCSDNALINFLISVYKTNEDVYVTYDDTLGENEDSIQNRLYASNYSSIQEKHDGADIEWEMNISKYADKDDRTLYGCGSYIILNGIDSDVVVQ